jgi:adenylyl-sulfate kinase
LGQQPKTIWFTGLSASGKSTLAYALERRLIDIGRVCYVLDGDNIRHGLSKDLSFTDQHRSENIRRVAEVAKLMNDAGLIVISSFISPSRNDRALAKNIVGDDNFIEIYISTPIDFCEKRDPKGMYKKARLGEIEGFTGVGSIYEAPESPFMSIDTSVSSIDECLESLICGIHTAVFGKPAV